MSDPPPPPYITRTFVCRSCGTAFDPPPEEAEALEALEMMFGLDAAKAEATCETCNGRRP